MNAVINVFARNDLVQIKDQDATAAVVLAVRWNKTMGDFECLVDLGRQWWGAIEFTPVGGDKLTVGGYATLEGEMSQRAYQILEMRDHGDDMECLVNAGPTWLVQEMLEMV